MNEWIVENPWWTGLVVYSLLAWLVLFPLFARDQYRTNKKKVAAGTLSQGAAESDCIVLAMGWVVAPVFVTSLFVILVVIIFLYFPLCLLLFGEVPKSKEKADGTR